MRNHLAIQIMGLLSSEKGTGLSGWNPFRVASRLFKYIEIGGRSGEAIVGGNKTAGGQIEAVSTRFRLVWPESLLYQWITMLALFTPYQTDNLTSAELSTVIAGSRTLLRSLPYPELFSIEVKRTEKGSHGLTVAILDKNKTTLKSLFMTMAKRPFQIVAPGFKLRFPGLSKHGAVDRKEALIASLKVMLSENPTFPILVESRSLNDEWAFSFYGSRKSQEETVLINKVTGIGRCLPKY